MLPLILISCIASVLGHGGLVWPPSWQDGGGITSIEDDYTGNTYSDPPISDPGTGKKIKSFGRWLTDQAYLGGHGTELHRGKEGKVTNFEEGGCSHACRKHKVPWSSPGKAMVFGGGCGVFGGNPYGCKPTFNDTRSPGSPCLGGGTIIYGSDAREIEFPNATTTEWLVGSVEEVAWTAKGFHKGGYMYRLCKLGEKGKKGITEECFQKNILSFATDVTMVRKGGKENLGNWTMDERKKDVSVGTNPEGSVWRRTTEYSSSHIRKDEVVVPDHLPEGDYVLSFRWDGATKEGQVWQSCANVRLVA